jgi:hypothetical protein
MMQPEPTNILCDGDGRPRVSGFCPEKRARLSRYPSDQGIWRHTHLAQARSRVVWRRHVLAHRPAKVSRSPCSLLPTSHSILFFSHNKLASARNHSVNRVNDSIRNWGTWQEGRHPNWPQTNVLQGISKKKNTNVLQGWEGKSLSYLQFLLFNL